MKRIMFLSDLHIDFNEQFHPHFVVELAGYILSESPYIVVIAGDIAGGADKCIEYIEEIECIAGVPIYYVPGNHSVWTSDVNSDSWEQYYRLLIHKSSLVKGSLVIGDYAIIGGMSWYDYSFAERKLNREQIIEHKKSHWVDYILARWGMDDEELCSDMLIGIEDKLNEHKDKKAIFVNHFIPYEEFVTFKNDKNWNRSNAFMGTLKLGELLDRYFNVEYVVFGHTHRRYGTVDFFGKKVICNPLGYVGEWESKYLVDEIRKAATIIEV